MKMQYEKINKAIELRALGFSYQAIADGLGVSAQSVFSYAKKTPLKPPESMTKDRAINLINAVFENDGIRAATRATGIAPEEFEKAKEFIFSLLKQK
jgi:predicted transcriptional regulator